MTSSLPHKGRTLLLNSGILIADRIIRLIGNATVVIWMARHFGPGEFGLFSYAQSLVVMATALATLGLPEIVLRELVRHPSLETEIVRASLILRFLGGSAAAIVAGTLALLADGPQSQSLLLTAILSASLIFQSLDVFEYRLQAHHRVPTIVLIRLSAFAIAAALKITALAMNGSLATMAILTTLEAVIAGASLVAANGPELHSKHLRFLRYVALSLMRQASPLFVRVAVISLYLRGDQILIKWMLGPEPLGIYASAVRLIEIWFFVPTAIMTAFAPTLARYWLDDRQAYYRLFGNIMRILTLTALCGCAIATILSNFIITTIFGHAYADAAPVLSVIVWSIIFGTIGQITNSWIINFGNTKIALAQTAISTSIAICLYPILISNFSLIGAAFAFVFAQMTMNFSLNYFFKSTRPMFIFQMNILFFKKLDPMIIFK